MGAIDVPVVLLALGAGILGAMSGGVHLVTLKSMHIIRPYAQLFSFDGNGLQRDYRGVGAGFSKLAASYSGHLVVRVLLYAPVLACNAGKYLV